MSSVLNGGSSDSNSHEKRPPTQVVVTLPFLLRPRFRDKEFLHRRYVIEGRSIAQISAEIGSSKEAVRNGLRRFEIGIRDPGRHHGHPAQASYGQKVILGQLIRHNREHRAKLLIKELRTQGFSLREIARELSERQIHSKKRLQTWHPQTIARILSTDVGASR